MNKVIFHIAIIAIFSTLVHTSFAQKPYKKMVKARKSLKEAQLDLKIADEDLMIAQVDSIVQLEKAKKIIADKKAADKLNNQTLKQKQPKIK